AASASLRVRVHPWEEARPPRVDRGRLLDDPLLEGFLSQTLLIPRLLIPHVVGSPEVQLAVDARVDPNVPRRLERGADPVEPRPPVAAEQRDVGASDQRA